MDKLVCQTTSEGGVYAKEFELYQAKYGVVRCVVAICARENEISQITEKDVREEGEGIAYDWRGPRDGNADGRLLFWEIQKRL